MSVPEIFRTIDFTEPERTPEASLAYAIAERQVLELDRFHSTLWTGLGYEPYSTSPFFQAAGAEGLAAQIQSCIESGEPPHDPWSMGNKIRDSISDGDWVTLWEENDKVLEETEQNSPFRMKELIETAASTIGAARIVTHPAAETDSSNMLLILSHARTLAEKKDTPVERMYQEEDNYNELIAATFDPVKYAKSWQQVSKGLPAYYIETFTRTAMVCERLLNLKGDNLLVAPKEFEVKEAIKKMMKDPYTKRIIQRDIRNRQAVANQMLASSLTRFWGETTAESVLKASKRKKGEKKK